MLDFGLAKGLEDEDVSLGLSIEGEVSGTPAYMSPERSGTCTGDLLSRVAWYCTLPAA